MNEQNNKKWKEFLLKSSLPLEQIVSEKIVNQEFILAGEYPYVRPNKQDVNTEFSVDLWAFNRFPDKSAYTTNEKSAIAYMCHLNLLVECKYNYPGVKWVFSPATKYYSLPTPAYIYSLVRNELSEDDCHITVYPLSMPLSECTRGIELYHSGSDPNSIPHGLSQLRYGMPNLILQQVKLLQQPPITSLRLALGRSFICLILVTTAQLYVLNSSQSLETYFSAEVLEDVAKQVPALMVTQDRGPHLQLYCEDLFGEQLKKVKLNPSEIHPLDETIDTFIPESFSIFVVNIDALDSFLESLKLDVTS